MPYRKYIEQLHSEEVFKDLLDAAPDAIVIINEQGEIILINAQTERLFGYTRKELLGQLVEILIPSSFHKQHPEHRRHFFRHPRTRAMGSGRELYAQHKDGSQFPVEISLSPLELPKGLVVLGAIRDVTENKRANDRLRAITHTLEVQNQELEQFTYLTSHDLQEPLRIITSFIELFIDKYRDVVDEEGQQELQFINNAVKKMSQLIHDLLDYSRLGRDSPVETVNCHELLTTVLQELSASLLSSGARVEISPHLPTLQGLKKELQLLFTQLIDNAIKFGQPNEPVIISIRAEPQAKGWLFAVEDNGIGIPCNYRDKIFQAFQRLHSKEAYQGTGIGLAYCKKIVQLHNGTIWVEDSTIGGTAFLFTLNDIEEKLS